MKQIKTIEDLRPDPSNANQGTPRGHGIIENSVRRHGAGRSGLAAKDGTMIAGSQTLEEMAALGIPIKPVYTKGDEWVVVIREDIEPGSEQAVLMAIEDNRATEVGLSWSPDVLASLSGEMDLSHLFHPDELAALLEATQVEAGAGGDEFQAEPADGPTRTALGDLWIIGGVHRLLVADCTDPANAERLMGGERADMAFTDSPYNISYQDNESIESLKARNRRTDGKIVENDNDPDISIAGFRQMVNTTKPGGALYLCFPAEQPLVLGAMWQQPARMQSMIVWLKNRMVMGRKDYHYQHEPLWYGWKEGAAHRWYGGHTQTTVWEIDRPTDSEDHPTVKPIALPQRAIENSSQPNDIVVDFFAGTGTTLTAAHRTNRRAFLMEISPMYADVCLRRFEAEGLTCERVEG